MLVATYRSPAGSIPVIGFRRLQVGGAGKCLSALKVLRVGFLVLIDGAAWTGRPMVLAGIFTALMNICFYESHGSILS